MTLKNSTNEQKIVKINKNSLNEQKIVQINKK